MYNQFKLRVLSKRQARRTLGVAVASMFLFSGALKAQLSGTYTVCASGCDYSSVQASVNALTTNGVKGAVTIEIQPGNYVENVSLTAIGGVSSTNTVTFKGTGTKNTDVRIVGTGGTAFTITKAQQIILDNIHFETQNYVSNSHALNILQSQFITVQNCRATAAITTSYIGNHSAINLQNSSDITIQNNYCRGGSPTCVGDNFSGSNMRVKYEHNLLTKFFYYGIMVNNTTDPIVRYNTFDSTSSGPGQQGIYASGTQGNGILRGNSFSSLYFMVYAYASAGKLLIDSNYTGSNVYYGMQVDCASNGTVTSTRNRIHCQGIGFYVFGSGTNQLWNNMIDMNGGSYGFYISPSSSSAHFDIAHNTLYFSGSYPIYQLNDIGAKDIKIRNNLITMTNSATLYFNTPLYGNIIDDNDMYRTGGGFAAYIAGKTYTSFADYKAALISYGTGLNEQNTSVTYINAPADLHLSSSVAAPYSYAIPGIITDYDSDPRCTVLATTGADESKNTTGGNYAKISGTKFTGPSKSYMNFPTEFLNANVASHYKWTWYVDGVKVSDSSHLNTKALKYPKSEVKLVAANCSYKDSFTMNVTVDSPTTTPVSDFISDVNSINQNELVHFTDLSVGYPSSWKWSVTPASGPNGSTHTYLLSSETSQNPTIRFTEPGVYKVCLTTANAKGKGSVECKSAYVQVTPAVVLKKGSNVVSAPSGYIYDNGGPNGNTKGAYYWDKPFPGATITGCFDSVYLVFKKFEMNPGYEFVRVYEGKDNTGKLLHPICNKPSTDYVGGLSGGPNFTGTYNCSPIRNGSTIGSFVYDTFKAASSMYIEFESYSSGSYLGFEAYYWTKPRSAGKPTASFTSIDSVCVATGITFTNTSKDAGDATYLWDLDDDMSAFESTSKNTSYAYFAPGTYKITLIASNCGGTDTFTKNITIFNPKAPVTSFTADNTTPTLNDVVFLSTDMPMCVDDYTWTITPASGAGKAVYVNGSKSTSAAPQVMFTDTGCYDVQLVTKNVSGQDQLKLTCFIKVRKSYCVPTTKFKAADLGISEVKLNTLDNKSAQGQTPYTNYTLDPTKNTTIEIGVTYDLTVSRTTNLNKISRTAWIDWNVDGDFDDAGEQIGTQSNSSSLDWTTQVKVPTLAKAGATVLRVAVNQGSQTNTACGPNVFGEYEDYRIYVRPDATRPVITLLGSDTVRIEQGQTYTDAGATAQDNLDGNVTSKIKVATVPKFDNMTPDIYIYKYNVMDAAGNEAIEVRRVVIVGPDKTAPNLIVAQSDTVHVEVFDATFTIPDVLLAEDLVDGDLSTAVQKSGNVDINTVGTYEVTYTVTDGSGNTATVKRVIVVEDKTSPLMSLIGNSTVNQEVGTPFKDSGVTVSDNYYAEAELRKVLSVQNNVDVTKLGTYTVVYTLTDPSGNGPVTVTRTVIVIDSQAPVATLKGDATMHMEVNTQFVDPGITITDNYDNITIWDTTGTFYPTFNDGFANKLGSYEIIYTVMDASGNTATVKRTVIVEDKTPPVVIRLGEPSVNVCRWAVYTDPGIDYSDNYDKKSDLTVTEEGSFTKNRTMFGGRYNLRYKVADKSGNVSYSDWRSIDVLEPNEGECVTAIKDNDQAGKYVNVYPNPNNGSFTVSINMPKTEQVKITFTNLLGQQIGVIAEGMMSDNTLSVDFSNQPSGVYLLNIQTATQHIVKRVVVNK